MDGETIRWVFGAVITLQTVVISALARVVWNHVSECKAVTATVSRIDTNISHIMKDIGTHETGMRGTIHKMTQMVYAHELKIAAMERK